jgi:hypothetical protein
VRERRQLPPSMMSKPSGTPGARSNSKVAMDGGLGGGGGEGVAEQGVTGGVESGGETSRDIPKLR